jgi:hypothetical protein
LTILFPSVIFSANKEALLYRYTESKFTGGRGPELYQKARFNGIYKNNVYETDWKHFSGKETIEIPINHKLYYGWHTYSGRLLI